MHITKVTENMNDELVKEIVAILREPIFNPKAAETAPEKYADCEELVALYSGLMQLRTFVRALGDGTLSEKLSFKGYLAGTLKALQGNLRHMTWQTQMIAGGDFSQRLDFLGEFSTAFNSMTMQLEESIRIIKEKEEELERKNDGLQKEMEQRRAAQAALAESEAHFRTLTETMQDVVLMISVEEHRATYVSPSVKALLGWEPGEVMRREFHELFAPGSFSPWEKRVTETLAKVRAGDLETEESHFSIEAELLCRDDSTVWTDITAHFDLSEGDNALNLHCVIRDVSERRTLRMELERQATMDELTGLTNRRAFMDGATKEIARSRRHGSPCCMLMMDIDHFKGVNDTHGHGVGDLALKAVSRVCADSLRVTDLLGRIGGEEFAVLMPETPVPNAGVVAERLRANVEAIELYTDEGVRVPLTISLGATQFDLSEDLNSLMARADKLLYEAKETGRNKTCMDEPL